MRGRRKRVERKGRTNEEERGENRRERDGERRNGIQTEEVIIKRHRMRKKHKSSKETRNIVVEEEFK